MKKTSLVILGATVTLTAQAFALPPNAFEQDLLDRVDTLPACTPDTMGVVPACVDRGPDTDGDPIIEDATVVIRVEASTPMETRLRRQLARERATRQAHAAGWTPRLTRMVGEGLAAQAGWRGAQWRCLDQLVWRESRWTHTARNPTSGAYGIPQALPASKLATAGSDWRTNPVTQTRWLLRYVHGRYGAPCSALAFHRIRGWY